MFHSVLAFLVVMANLLALILKEVFGCFTVSLVMLTRFIAFLFRLMWANYQALNTGTVPRSVTGTSSLDGVAGVDLVVEDVQIIRPSANLYSSSSYPNISRSLRILVAAEDMARELLNAYRGSDVLVYGPWRHISGFNLVAVVGNITTWEQFVRRYLALLWDSRSGSTVAIRFLVPSQSMGRIKGDKGSMIRRLSRDHRCNITTQPLRERRQQERWINVSGPSDELREVVVRILVIIAMGPVVDDVEFE